MSPAAPRRAFTLVEVTLALGIAVFCLLVVFGLMNVGVNTGSAAVEQTNATNILSMVASDLRAAPTPSLQANGTMAAGAPSAIYGLTLPVNNGAGATTQATKTLDANGQLVSGGAAPRYQLDASMKSGVDRAPTLVRLTISWPPNAAVKSGTVETLVALDRN